MPNCGCQKYTPQIPPVNSREDTGPRGEEVWTPSPCDPANLVPSPLADTVGGEGTREALRLAKEVAASCEKQPSPLGALAQIMKHPIEVKDVAVPTLPSKQSEECDHDWGNYDDGEGGNSWFECRKCTTQRDTPPSKQSEECECHHLASDHLNGVCATIGCHCKFLSTPPKAEGVGEKKIWHICIRIDSAIQALKNGTDLFPGQNVTVEQLEKMKAEGVKIINSEECENVGEDGTCQGCPEPNEWEKLEMPFEFRCIGTNTEGWRIVVNDLRDGEWIFSQDRIVAAFDRYQNAILDKITSATREAEKRKDGELRRLFLAYLEFRGFRHDDHHYLLYHDLKTLPPPPDKPTQP